MSARRYRRARRAFWLLLAAAVLLTGALSWALRAPPSPGTGLAVAVLGAVLAIVVALAVRVLLALTGADARRGEAARQDRRR